MDRRFTFRFLLLVIPFCTIVIVTGLVVLHLLNDKQMQQMQVRERANLGSAESALRSQLSGVAGDLDFLSEHAAFRDLIESDTQEYLARVEHNFLQFSLSQKVYDQIRWIDETGMERVRVDYHDGHPAAVARQELQNKSDRYYFLETMMAPAGAVYVSSLDLNVENNRVEIPHRPMLRVARRIEDASGKVRGILVLNMDASVMLAEFVSALGESSTSTSLLNKDGFWLHSPDKTQDWGFMLGQHETFMTRFPDVARTLWSDETGQFRHGAYLWTWSTLHPNDIIARSSGGRVVAGDGARLWKIVSQVPLVEIYGEGSPYRRMIFLYSVALMGLGVVAGFLFVRAWMIEEDFREHESQRIERDSESRFELLLSSSPNGMVVVDAQGMIIRANEQIATMLGYTQAQLLCMSVDDLVPDYVAMRHARYRADFAKHPSMRKLGSGRDLAARHAGGHNVAVEVSLAPFHMNNEPLVLATVVDITERKRTEAALNTLNNTLEQRVRHRTTELEAANRELEAFTYAVSHDLRAPLRALIGFSTALIEDCGDRLDDQAREYLGEITFASKSMGALIDGLLALSRSTQGMLERKPVDISALATRIVQEISHANPLRKVTWKIAAGLSTHGDARMIETALRNLLDNAWKYTSKVAQAHIELFEENTPVGRRFVLRDNGAGFDMAHAERLFKPFQRLHRQDEFQGVGIGLATVMRVIRRHGGVIDVSSKPDNGATFKFSFEPDTAMEAENGRTDIAG